MAVNYQLGLLDLGYLQWLSHQRVSCILSLTLHSDKRKKQKDARPPL